MHCFRGCHAFMFRGLYVTRRLFCSLVRSGVTVDYRVNEYINISGLKEPTCGLVSINVWCCARRQVHAHTPRDKERERCNCPSNGSIAILISQRNLECNLLEHLACRGEERRWRTKP
ncbi:hypothetical protein M404DRAFT_512243 [Pisolithus tinctorius Marx 270]|uniref:Secreted protein n=1 Tax=Pisolithus tinctorius Marx 270 TaxID=870435 RepID=A0A0C3J960_PISTI|nr:hypothetical protein M404DRAFT_512243 [Pisolithus tinctorius Marx 270]